MNSVVVSTRAIRAAIVVVQLALLAACGWTVREADLRSHGPRTQAVADAGVVATSKSYFGQEYAAAHEALRGKAVEPLPPTF